MWERERECERESVGKIVWERECGRAWGRECEREKESVGERVWAGMTLDKCIFRLIWTITGCPLSTERCPLCRFKNPTVI